jgi:tetratricopeptide (TPR) repeat protein
MDYRTLSQTELFERISQGSSKGNGKSPPLTLILGSGFSYGVIPTTAQIVQKDLPWWDWCQREEQDGPTLQRYRETRDAPDDLPTKANARAFWQRVLDCHRRQPDKDKAPINLDADGVPDKDSVGAAYRFVLSSACTPGLCEPDSVRRYFGDMIRRADRRTNPAHLFLASIIAEKPRLFGTIFTTNFDPLLQRSLQLVNAAYFVSDRPDTLEYPDDDEVVDPVHVIHTHGSIYRYLLVNTPDAIKRYAQENQAKLQEYFRKHAVLIVGFAGWDDAITNALAGVTTFARSLYWLDRGGSLESSSLTPVARGILAKHDNAFYVPIKSADDVMAQLHQHLTTHALPQVLRDPILVAKEQLKLCDLSGVKVFRSRPGLKVSADGKGSVSSDGGENVDLGNEAEAVGKRLDAAQDLFTGKTSTDENAILLAKVRRQFAAASDHYFSDRYEQALPELEFVLAHAPLLDPAERALAYFRRGYVYSQRGDVSRAIEDYTFVIDMPDAPAERKARSLVNRGCMYGQRGDAAHAIADSTAVIDMPDAPADQKAGARINRGVVYGRRGEAGDVERAITDFTAVIDMPDALAEQKAKARFNRGVRYGQRGDAGDVEREIADYTAVIDMSDAPAEQKAGARFNRGISYGQRGEGGDVERAIADYTAVIDMPDAPAEQKADARFNRGITYGQRWAAGDVEHAITDYTAVIDMPDAPAEQKANARVNRGATYSQRGEAGDVERAIADYTVVIDMPDAPAEQKADARFNRGITYGQRREAGDLERGIADYTAVIDMPDAPAEQKAMARVNRGVSYGQRGEAGDVERAITDYTAVIDMPDASAELKAAARDNLKRLKKPKKPTKPGRKKKT